MTAHQHHPLNLNTSVMTSIATAATVIPAKNGAHFIKVSRVSGSVSCVQSYRLRQRGQFLALSKRTAENPLLSKRTVKIIRGFQFRHGTCSAAIQALHCTCLLGFRRAAATATPAASAECRATSYGSSCMGSRADSGSPRSCTGAVRRGGPIFRNINAWGARQKLRGEVA